MLMSPAMLICTATVVLGALQNTCGGDSSCNATVGHALLQTSVHKHATKQHLTAPFTKQQVVDCFKEETARLLRQKLTESAFGVLGGASNFGSGSSKYNRKRVKVGKGSLLQTRSDKFVGAIIGGIAAVGGAIASGAHAVENAAADNCMEKGFESVLTEIESLQSTADATKEMVETLGTTISEKHKEVMAGQNEMQRAFRDGVAMLQGNQKEMIEEAKSFRASVEDSIGRLDEQLSGVVRNQMTLSLQLDQLSLQLYGTEQRLLAEDYAGKSATIIANAKVITGAVEDIQDLMGRIYDHRLGWPTLDLDDGNDPLANVIRWGNTERSQQQQLKEIAGNSWTRARDAFSAMAVGLSEGDFLRKYFLEGLRVAAEEYVESVSGTNSGNCGIVIKDIQPLLDHLSSKVLHQNELIEVLVDSIIQVHDVFKTMVLIFGRYTVSPAQYKESLITIHHAFNELTREFADHHVLLKLVQTLVSPVLSTKCPLSPGCRDGAFVADHIAARSKGVQVSSDTIAFEPLSHIAHSSADAAFYQCSARPSPIPIEIDQGRESKADVMWPPNCQYCELNRHSKPLYDACSSTEKTHKLSCPVNYVMRALGKSTDLDVTFKCTRHKKIFRPDPAIQWYNIQWQAKSGTGSWEDADDETFQCELNVGQASHQVSTTRKTSAEADALVDSNYAAWSLGGSEWTAAAGMLTSTLATATEDAVSRLFLISDNVKCAEDLPHGNLATVANGVATANWDRETPYFCWDCVVERHDQWLQEVLVTSNVELSFTLIWKFDERLTLHERLTKAINEGVAVTWEADWGNNQHKTVTGTWRFSRQAKADKLSTHDGGISNDDGGWAAGQYVDGEAGHSSGVQFGHVNQNAGDHHCQHLWVNGVKYNNQQFTSRMYVVY